MEKSFGRGDIVWIDFAPAKGHERTGKRPAAVLSPRAYNDKVGLMLVCPVTSRVKGYPFEVPLKGKVRGAMLVDHVRSIDWRERKAEHAARASPAAMRKVQHLLSLLLQ